MRGGLVLLRAPQANAVRTHPNAKDDDEEADCIQIGRSPARTGQRHNNQGEDCTHYGKRPVCSTKRFMRQRLFER